MKYASMSGITGQVSLPPGYLFVGGTLVGKQVIIANTDISNQDLGPTDLTQAQLFNVKIEGIKSCDIANAQIKLPTG